MDLICRIHVVHLVASGVVGAPRPDGVVFETKSGPIVVMARAIVDATGDGDVAALAGAPVEIGRASDARGQPMTLMFRSPAVSRARTVNTPSSPQRTPPQRPACERALRWGVLYGSTAHGVYGASAITGVTELIQAGKDGPKLQPAQPPRKTSVPTT